MIKLPFLKNSKVPRIAEKPPEEVLVNGSSDELVDDQCMSELFEAVESKDVSKFRSALEVLIMNRFEQDNDDAT